MIKHSAKLALVTILAIMVLLAGVRLLQQLRTANNTEQQHETRVRIARHELQRDLQQIKASSETLRYQQRTLEAEREKSQAGTDTSLLVAQAQRDLLAVMIAEKETWVQARLALLDLFVAEGSLLARRGLLTGDQKKIVNAQEQLLQFSRELGVIDAQGHGPDILSEEWLRAVDFKMQQSVTR